MLILTIIVFLLILGIIVCIHEFGHFIVARRAGVLVEEFGLGMPPRAIGVQRIKGKWEIIMGNRHPRDITHTIYSLNWLPLGGFVKLYGDGAGGEGGDIDPKYASLAFEHKNVWARAAVMVAGVTMNVLLAAVIYYFLLAKSGFVSDRIPLIGSPRFVFGSMVQSIAAIEVKENSPAARAGIKKEDVILRVKPVKASEWVAIAKPSDLITEVKKNNGNPVMVELKDFTSGAMRTVTVTPQFDAKEKRAMIGVSLANLVQIRYDKPHEKLLAGFMHSYNLTTYNVQLVGTIVSYAFESKQPQLVGDAVSGPVAIGSVVGDTLRKSGDKVFDNLLNLAALISLSLAFMNILPIPALDGGRLMILLPEMFLRKKVPKNVERYINVVGFVLLMALSVLITVKDIIRAL